jgi:hypothetical protein
MRKEIRFFANALVYVAGDSSEDGGAKLKDVSINGLSIQSKQFLDIAPNSPYLVIVVPEKEADIEKFKLEIESRWIRMNGDSVDSGFSIAVPFKGKELERYLEYLSKVNPAAKKEEKGDAPQESLTLIDSAE